MLLVILDEDKKIKKLVNRRFTLINVDIYMQMNYTLNTLYRESSEREFVKIRERNALNGDLSLSLFVYRVYTYVYSECAKRHNK